MAKTKKERKADKDLLVKIRDRYKAMVEADRENRKKALDDLKFCNVPGEQWEHKQKQNRGEARCLEFNKIRPTVKRVVNEMRKNRPQGKVRAVEDGDKDTADVYEGLCRNIWNVSDADTVIDYAGEYQVGGGMGAWRVTTRYAHDTAFEQDILIEAIKNPFCLYADNACADPLKRDARDWVLIDRIAKTVYEEKYGKAEVVEFEAETEFDDDDEWKDDETVRICEYWYKEPVTKTIYLLGDGKTVDSLEGLGPVQVLKSREVNTHKILMCIASGDAILEGPVAWAGSNHPFILIYGDWLVIDGKIHWSGLTRHAKDAQRVYNNAAVAAMEYVAMSPKAHEWATAKQAQGLEGQWAEANVKNFPVRIYNADPASPGPPVMVSPPPVPMGLVEEMRRAGDDIKATTGIFDASLGAQGNETSGRAISARQAQGEVATFNFADNMGKGIRRTYEILIDLIPKIYDTERSVRILGVDGAEKYKRINESTVDPQTGQPTVVNDMARGKYDVTITVGPSYSTQRQEAAEVFTAIAAKDPAFMQVAGDLLFKSLDVPLADQLAERYKFALLPAIQQQLSQEGAQDPQVKAAMAQVQQAAQMVEEKGKLITAAEQELKELQAQAKGDQASAKLAQASLAGEEAKLVNMQKDLERAEQALEDAKQMALAEIAHAQEVLALNEKLVTQRIQGAHDKAAHALESAGRDQDDANDETQRAVGDQIKDASHQQQLREAKASNQTPA